MMGAPDENVLRRNAADLIDMATGRSRILSVEKEDIVPKFDISGA